MFLFRASMAFISSSVREKLNIWQRKSLMLSINYTVYMWLPNMTHRGPELNRTWKLCLILSGLKLLGITTTPLWALKRRATWALLLLYFLPIDTRSSSSSRGGHFTFTLNRRHKKRWNSKRDRGSLVTMVTASICSALSCKNVCKRWDFIQSAKSPESPSFFTFQKICSLK